MLVRLLLGIAALLGGAAIPLIGWFWIAASHYRRARLAMFIDDPVLVTGVGWRVLLVACLCAAAMVGGAVMIWTALRRSGTRT